MFHCSEFYACNIPIYRFNDAVYVYAIEYNIQVSHLLTMKSGCTRLFPAQISESHSVTYCSKQLLSSALPFCQLVGEAPKKDDVIY